MIGENASIVTRFLGSEKRNRSHRKNQWIDSYDDVEEQWNEEFEEEQQIKRDIQAQWDEIHQAINENNADLLCTLLPPVNLYNTKEKYWSRDFHWHKYAQGENILLRAVDLQHADCVKVILDKVSSKDLPHTIRLRSVWWGPCSRTAPQIACEKGNLNIVQILVEHDRTWPFPTNAFFIAFEQGHEHIMNYLVAKCDLRESVNRDGLTALDRLISRGYLEIAKLLIHYGDTQRNGDGFSPMMLAVHHDLTPLVDLLFQRLPLQEALDELMLLACHYIIHGDAQNRQKAFDLFVRGLTEGELPDNSVSREAYEHRQECKTVDEFVSIWDDDNAMRMYSLVVSERILLRLGDVDVLLKLIDQQCCFYRDNRLFHRLLQIRIHTQHIAINHQFDQTLLSKWYKVFVEGLMRDLDIVWNETETVSIEWMEMISTCVFDNEKFYYPLQFFHLLERIVSVSL